MIFLILIIFTFPMQCFSQEALGVVSDHVQLQQLISQSEKQIQFLKDILDYKKQDAASLEKATHILEEMSSGIDKSIQKYQNTETYDKALLDLQSKNDFEKTYSDSEELTKHEPITRESKKTFDDIVKFQKDSVRANQFESDQQRQLEQDLQTAQQGFIPKLQAQAQLSNWKTNTRISTQMTELLADLHAIRGELRIMRQKEEGPNTLSMLITGSEIQNNKLKEANHK